MGRSRLHIGLLPCACLALALPACGSATSALPAQVNPFKVEKVAGSEIARLHLEPSAVQKAQLQTEPVQPMTSGGASASSASVPYRALMYKPDGTTWVYTNPNGSTFVRHPVTVERFDGDRVVVTNGPPAGTRVVTDGAAELYGVEFGVGK